MFSRGEFVWGKIKGYPWWPAMVLDGDDCDKKKKRDKDDCDKKKKRDKLWLFWFGDHKISKVHSENILHFRDHFCNKTMKKSGELFKKAVVEILQVLASKHELKFKDSTSILAWANSGFKSSVWISFKWVNAKLPELVEKALRDDDVEESDDEESDDEESDESDMDIDDIIRDVHEGKKSLEDICISCCKRNVKLIAPHPLLIGSICVECERSVCKVCKVPYGHRNDACIICASRTNIKYCSNSLCRKAFCKLCIVYMVSKKAYLQISENKKWFCYLCKVNPDKKSLITKRTHYPKESFHPQVPQLKSSINVLASSEIGLNVLQKAKIKVRNYYIYQASEETPLSKLLNHCSYLKDFPVQELKEISADLILGSYFLSDISNEQRENVSQFFCIFFQFLYRLDITRVHNTFAFFIFVADAFIFDENILSRVMRFLMVRPISIRFGVRKVLLWTNFSNSLPKGCKFPETESSTDDKTAEERIMFPFIKQLQNFMEKQQE